MKKNANAASNNENSGLYRLYRELLKDDYAVLKPRLRIHLIGHSAGAIFHAFLLEKLLAAGLQVDGIYFMAPACRIDLFQASILPHYSEGKVKAFTQFNLTDTAERQDNCATIYRRSLLYPVSNSFEHHRGTPLLGMQKFVDPATLVDNRPAHAEEWTWIHGANRQRRAKSGPDQLNFPREFQQRRRHANRDPGEDCPTNGINPSGNLPRAFRSKSERPRKNWQDRPVQPLYSPARACIDRRFT